MSDGLDNPLRPRNAEAISTSRWQAVAEIFFIFVVFFVHAGWPVPDVNESHYLCKAKQYWNPDWLPGDFFLAKTGHAHHVFYWTFGWLTRWLSLPAFAWCGRVLVWALMAWAWRRLSFTLVPLKWYAVLTAALFAVWSTYADLSGEWVIGGLEAKGPAYVLLLLGLERLARDRWNTALVLFGAASAFHVLVGGWTVIAAALAWLLTPDRPRLAKLSPGLIGGFLLALPGLIPAIALSWDVPEKLSQEANRIYVLWRLRHHLLPHYFSLPSVLAHVGLAACCIFCYWLLSTRRVGTAHQIRAVLVGDAHPTNDPVRQDDQHREQHRRVGGVMLGAVIVAVAGYVVAWALQWDLPKLAAAMRYYWFRGTDVLVPVCAAIWLPKVAWLTRPALLRGLLLCAIVAPPVFLLGRDTYARLGAPPRADEPAHSRAWIAVCREIQQHTPRDAVFLTPRPARTFHWYAQRAEVVNQKNTPQDTRSIVKWYRRLKDVHKVHHRGFITLSQQGPAELRRLAARYRADYVVTYASPPLDLPRVPWSRNRTFAVYDLR